MLTGGLWFAYVRDQEVARLSSECTGQSWTLRRSLPHDVRTDAHLSSKKTSTSTRRGSEVTTPHGISCVQTSQKGSVRGSSLRAARVNTKECPSCPAPHVPSIHGSLRHQAVNVPDDLCGVEVAVSSLISLTPAAS